MNFQGKVALVAGGTGALGREVAMAFLESGATVVVTYRRAEEYKAFIATAQTTGVRAPGGAALDVTDTAAVEAMVAALVAQHGRLDILVNTVGGYAGGKNLWESGSEMYARMMGLNLQAGFALARAAMPVMIRQNSGWIVNVASKAGYGHSPGAALYAASKAGALALFDSLADEVKPYNINVNSIVPSIFDSAANRQDMPGADYSKWPKPEEIARVVLFLCSEDARVIHGAAVPVYGRT
jgi:NAD(P)-dependent dehydrogenase (short-subunit alcohol dehydrogenase family)